MGGIVEQHADVAGSAIADEDVETTAGIHVVRVIVRVADLTERRNPAGRLRREYLRRRRVDGGLVQLTKGQ